MKLRLTGSEKDFEIILSALTSHKDKFDSWRKPQKGNNPKYKEGGEKFDPKKGEQSLMYLEIDAVKLKTLLLKSKQQ